jgi:DNA-binding NarL/FixJ family response regulator
MLAQFSKPTSARPPSIRSAGTTECETGPERVALVAPPGLFRDGFAHLIASHLVNIRLECQDRIEDVVPGPARLVLIVFDPSLCSREALRAKIEALRARCDGAPIGVVLPEVYTATGLSALGVTGVVSQSAGVEIAIAAVHLMLVGGYCLPPEIPATAASSADIACAAPRSHFQCTNDTERAELHRELTAREFDVLRSLREGNQNKLIAFELGISENTVKVHLRNLMKKLRASNRVQVALGAPSPSAGVGLRLRPASEAAQAAHTPATSPHLSH